MDNNVGIHFTRVYSLVSAITEGTEVEPMNPEQDTNDVRMSPASPTPRPSERRPKGNIFLRMYDEKVAAGIVQLANIGILKSHIT